jgi:integrase-like protein
VDAKLLQGQRDRACASVRGSCPKSRPSTGAESQATAPPETSSKPSKPESIISSIRRTASGGFLEPRNINRAFHSLCARADVPQLRVHDLRHSCATLLFTMGVPPATVQRILRHSSITVTTGTYVEVIEAVQGDALDSMGTLFEQVGDDSSGRLSSMKPQLSSRLSSRSRAALRYAISNVCPGNLTATDRPSKAPTTTQHRTRTPDMTRRCGWQRWRIHGFSVQPPARRESSHSWGLNSRCQPAPLVDRPHNRPPVMEGDRTMKQAELVGTVAEHIDAINAGDTSRAVATFAEDAYVNDNSPRVRRITRGPGSRAAGIAMAYKLIEAAPHLVALVRAAARFENGNSSNAPISRTPR